MFDIKTLSEQMLTTEFMLWNNLKKKIYKIIQNDFVKSILDN